MSKVTLITGGARSGKSSFAEDYVKAKGENILYVATAKPIDDEMKDRIKKHQERRPAHWGLIAQPTACTFSSKPSSSAISNFSSSISLGVFFILLLRDFAMSISSPLSFWMMLVCTSAMKLYKKAVLA